MDNASYYIEQAWLFLHTASEDAEPEMKAALNVLMEKLDGVNTALLGLLEDPTQAAHITA